MSYAIVKKSFVVYLTPCAKARGLRGSFWSKSQKVLNCHAPPSVPTRRHLYSLFICHIHFPQHCSREKSATPLPTTKVFGVSLVSQLIQNEAEQDNKPKVLPCLLFQHQEAIRITRGACRHKQSADAEKTSLQILSKVVDASHQAYKSCVHPVRSDLLADHVNALGLCLAHCLTNFNDHQFALNVLNSIGLTAPYTVDPVESIRVLAYDLACHELFSPAELAIIISRVLRDILFLCQLGDVEPLIVKLTPHFSGIVAVAESCSHPAGDSAVKSTAFAMYNQRDIAFIKFHQTQSGDFNFTIGFGQSRVPLINLNRTQFRILNALFVGQQRPGRISYAGTSLIPPIKGNLGLLTLADGYIQKISIPRYFHIQNLFSRFNNSSEYQERNAERTSFFGDI